jgi:hypothetical protein
LLSPSDLIALSLSNGDFYGNRGISTTIDSNIFTTFSNLFNATPSSNAAYNVANKAYIKVSGPVTVWLRGFLAPAKTSSYELSLVIGDTNTNALVYLSTNDTSVNKVLIAYTNSSLSSSYRKAIVQMNAGQL